MPTRTIPNPTHAFPPSQGPATGPDPQESGYLELPNQDTVTLNTGDLVSWKVTSNVVGVVKTPTNDVGNMCGVVVIGGGVGSIVSVCRDGVAQATADAAITAGHLLVKPGTTAGRVADGGVPAGAAYAAAVSPGMIIGIALTAAAGAGNTFWMEVHKL